MFSGSWVIRKIDQVIRNENIVFYCASKTKLSVAYNQRAAINIISIVKAGKLPNSSTCEAFIDGERIPGGDRSHFQRYQLTWLQGRTLQWSETFRTDQAKAVIFPVQKVAKKSWWLQSSVPRKGGILRLANNGVSTPIRVWRRSKGNYAQELLWLPFDEMPAD